MNGLIVGCELRIADGPASSCSPPIAPPGGRLSRLFPQARRSADKDATTSRAMLDATRADEAAAEALPAAWRADPTRGIPCRRVPPATRPSPQQRSALAGEAFPGRTWIAQTPRLDGRDHARLHWILRIAQATGIPAVACPAGRSCTRPRGARSPT